MHGTRDRGKGIGVITGDKEYSVASSRIRTLTSTTVTMTQPAPHTLTLADGMHFV